MFLPTLHPSPSDYSQYRSQILDLLTPPLSTELSTVPISLRKKKVKSLQQSTRHSNIWSPRYYFSPITLLSATVQLASLLSLKHIILLTQSLCSSVPSGLLFPWIAEWHTLPSKYSLRRWHLSKVLPDNQAKTATFSNSTLSMHFTYFFLSI